MPIYEFSCSNKKCKYSKKPLEFILAITAKLPTKCTQCKKGKLKQLLSAGKFDLKGKGWFKGGMN